MPKNLGKSSLWQLTVGERAIERVQALTVDKPHTAEPARVREGHLRAVRERQRALGEPRRPVLLYAGGGGGGGEKEGGNKNL